MKALLVHAVDEEKRIPGIVARIIADDPQERWVVGHGRLSPAEQDMCTIIVDEKITSIFASFA